MARTDYFRWCWWSLPSYSAHVRITVLCCVLVVWGKTQQTDCASEFPPNHTVIIPLMRLQRERGGNECMCLSLLHGWDRESERWRREGEKKAGREGADAGNEEPAGVKWREGEEGEESLCVCVCVTVWEQTLVLHPCSLRLGLAQTRYPLVSSPLQTA